MGKKDSESDEEIIVPTFKMPDLTRSFPDDQLDEIQSLDPRERRFALALGKLTIVVTALTEFVPQLEGVMKLMVKEQRRQAEQQRLQGDTANRVVWYESKMKVVGAIILVCFANGIGVWLWNKFFGILPR